MAFSWRDKTSNIAQRFPEDGCMPLRIVPVILAGGTGTRLWPLSRAAFPKQFLHLTGERSLFQQTCERIHTAGFAKPLVLTHEDHRFIVAEQLRELGRTAKAIVLEPVRRNTAPAALVAALLAAQENEEVLLLLMPSDHVIDDREEFLRSIIIGVEPAQRGRMVIFGVAPRAAHPDYGYIETRTGNGQVLDVLRFVEKPPRERAERFLRAGNWWWNAGIFLFSARTLIDAFHRHAPTMLECCRTALSRACRDPDFLRLNAEAYARCEDISLDHAILERSHNIACVPLQAGWSDLGTWPALAERLTKDDAGNAGHGDVLFPGSRNCFAHGPDDILITVNDLEDILVVATHDAVLVTSKAGTSSIGDIAARLRQQGHPAALRHARVHRPWGWFETLATGERFLIKRLMVAPGARLSLQSHRHRAEHWIVLEGMVRTTVGEETRLLSTNETVHVPVGVRHRLENPGSTPAFLIEVQTGDYLDEDDIVRHDDPCSSSE